MKGRFGGASDSEILPTAGSILSALVKDPTLHPRIISLMPSEQQIKEAYERFQDSFNQVLAGDRDKASTRQERETLNRTLTRFAALVDLAAEVDPTLPQRTGLNVRAEKKTSTLSPAA